MTRPTEVQGAGNSEALLNRRVRWTFGSLQAVWKHRDLLRWRYGLLGWYVLPQYALAILVPLIFCPLSSSWASGQLRSKGSTWSCSISCFSSRLT